MHARRLLVCLVVAEHWTHLRTSDEIDKRFLRSRAIFSLRGRPRGEERSLGWKLRQVA